MTSIKISHFLLHFINTGGYILRELLVSYISWDKCKIKMSEYYPNNFFDETMCCAGGKLNEDACEVAGLLYLEKC